LPPATYFNTSGRGYPDIAAMGFNLVFTMNGALGLVSGTSVSTPIVAAMVGMLNQVSIAKTGKTLGFVSPLLYQMHADDPTIFQDITVGDNKCTEDGCNPFCYGYLCTTGWDRTCNFWW
jgi:tripeptidyl-peptidase-1